MNCEINREWNWDEYSDEINKYIESLMNFGIGTAIDSVVGSRIWDGKCEKNSSVFQKIIKSHFHK